MPAERKNAFRAHITGYRGSLVARDVAGERDDASGPALQDARRLPASDGALECMAARRQVLRAVIEPAEFGLAGRGPSARPAVLLEDGDLGASLRKRASAGKSGDAGADDGN